MDNYSNEAMNEYTMEDDHSHDLNMDMSGF